MEELRKEYIQLYKEFRKVPSINGSKSDSESDEESEHSDGKYLFMFHFFR